MNRLELLRVIILNDISSSSDENDILKTYQKNLISLLNKDKTELKEYIESNTMDIDIISNLVDKSNKVEDVNNIKSPSSIFDLLKNFDEYEKSLIGNCELINTLYSDFKSFDLTQYTRYPSFTQNVVDFIKILDDDSRNKYILAISKYTLEPYASIYKHFVNYPENISEFGRSIYDSEVIKNIPHHIEKLYISLLSSDLSSYKKECYDVLTQNIINFVEILSDDKKNTFLSSILDKHIDNRFDIPEPYKAIFKHFSPKTIMSVDELVYGCVFDDSAFRNIPISHIKNLLDSFVSYNYEDIPVELHETAVHNITKFIEPLDDADLIYFVKETMKRNTTPKMEVKQPFREIAMYFHKRIRDFRKNNATN